MKQRRNITGWLLLLLLSFTTVRAAAQYVVSGSAPASLRWKQIRAKDYKLIFPDYYLPKAQLVRAYLDTLQPHIGYGLRPLFNRLPVVLYPTNLHSNGLVTWAPKRVELYTAPPTRQFAVPWLKQLTLHEYRHVIQMSNLNIGFTKAASYLLGEQIIGLVAMVPPRWFFEGDAVAAETALTAFGRGLQPEFSIEYRAMVHEDEKFFNLDQWICGSLKENIPDKYKLGYQVVTAAREYYGADFWEKVIRYCGRNPYFIVSPNIAYRKYAGTDTRRLLLRTFNDLKAYWEKASSVPNTASFVDTGSRSYTLYEYPLPYPGGRIIARKKDMDSTYRFVVLDTASRRERTLRYSTQLSSRPILKGDTLLWTEYVPSLFWEQQNRSAVKAMRLKEKPDGLHGGRPYTLFRNENCFYITPTGHDGYAMIVYDRLNNPSVLLTDTAFRETGRLPLPGDDTSVNGMAWDDATGRLCIILLDNEGMYLAEILRKPVLSLRKLTQPSYITVDNLTARGGRLYFNSIQSGKDEAHIYDLNTGKEYRATTSQYGTVMPAAVNDSLLLAVTYRRNGYFPSVQPLTDSLREVAPARMPVNLLNPPRQSWGWQIDSIDITAKEAADAPPARRYARIPHLFRVHSWIPISLDVQELVDEHRFDLGIGITAMSQNTLGSMVTLVQYGWLPNKKSNYVMAHAEYTGLPLHLSLDLEYGGYDQSVYAPSLPESSPVLPFSDGLKKQLQATAGLSLPMNFSDGANIRHLVPFASFSYYNSLIYNYANRSLKKGNYKLTSGVSFYNYRYTTPKELNPKLGYLLRLSYTMNPVRGDFGKLLNLYARGYLPGFARLHSLTLEGNLQRQWGGSYNYLQKTLYPQGCYYDFASKNLFAAAASYRFPLAFPDGGIPNVLYFKRIALNLFGQYARNTLISASGDSPTLHPYTYGGELLLDFNVFRIGVDLNVGLSVYKPSDHRKPMFGASVGFGF